ncbi:MAG: hypothetical protein ACFCUG_01100 [Thiotrichales bacterium]
MSVFRSAFTVVLVVASVNLCHAEMGGWATINYDPSYLMADHDATAGFHSRFAFGGRVAPAPLGDLSHQSEGLTVERLGWFTQWHPWRGGLHLSGGLLYQDLPSQRMDAERLSVDRLPFSSDSLLEHGMDGLTSYLGLGWSTQNRPERRLGMRVELGLLSNDANQWQGGPGESVAGRLSIGKALGELDGLYFSPVFALGISYAF